MLIWGGVEWLVSGAIPARASEARERIRNAILGLLLILASFLIIQIINPELTTISGTPLSDSCDDPANAAKCASVVIPVADDTTPFLVPPGDPREGIFLCKREQCACEGDPCKEGNDPGSHDYWYIDPFDLGLATGPGVGEPGLLTLNNWNDKVESIAISGDYGVMLADGTDYSQTVVCFDTGDTSKGGRLDDFMKKSDGTVWGFKGAQSLKILHGGQCKSPGITLFNETNFWDDNIVFLFRNIEQGKWRENNIRYEIPIDYTPGNLIIPVPITRSIYVSPNTIKSAVLRQGVIGSPVVCFQDSVDDLSEYDWDPLNPPDDITDDIGSVGAIDDPVDCPPELDGVVH